MIEVPKFSCSCFCKCFFLAFLQWGRVVCHNQGCIATSRKCQAQSLHPFSDGCSAFPVFLLKQKIIIYRGKFIKYAKFHKSPWTLFNQWTLLPMDVTLFQFFIQTKKNHLHGTVPSVSMRSFIRIRSKACLLL